MTARTTTNTSFAMNNNTTGAAFGVDVFTNGFGQSGGWTYVTDSGATNPASNFGLVGTINTAAGYQIWRMNDSLSGTYPCYIKLEIGSGGATIAPSFWVTIGTGSNGAGTITGTLLNRTQISGGSNNIPGSTFTTRCSVGSNRFMYVGGAAAQNRILLSIERTKDSAGLDTGEGICVLGEGGSSGTTYIINRLLRYSDNTLSSFTTLGAFCPSGTTWSGPGNDVGVCPVRYFQGGPSNPGTNVLVYMNGDTATGISVPVSMYGNVITYMPVGTTTIASVVFSNANSTLMMRYD